MALALVALCAFALTGAGDDGPTPPIARVLPSVAAPLGSGATAAAATPSAASRAATPSTSATPSATADASPATAPPVTPSGTSTASASPAPTASAATGSPTAHITRLSFAASAPTCSARGWIKIDVTIATDGTTAITLQLQWLTLDASGASTVQSTDTVTIPPGQTSVTRPYSHTFPLTAQVAKWGVAVSTVPAPSTGNGSIQTCP